MAAHGMKGALHTGYVTQAERNVWVGIAYGLSNKQMAQIHACGVKAIEKHRASLYRVLGVSSVADVTRKAVTRGVISVEVTPLRCVAGKRYRRYML